MAKVRWQGNIKSTIKLDVPLQHEELYMFYFYTSIIVSLFSSLALIARDAFLFAVVTLANEGYRDSLLHI